MISRFVVHNIKKLYVSDNISIYPNRKKNSFEKAKEDKNLVKMPKGVEKYLNLLDLVFPKTKLLILWTYIFTRTFYYIKLYLCYEVCITCQCL